MNASRRVEPAARMGNQVNQTLEIPKSIRCGFNRSYHDHTVCRQPAKQVYVEQASRYTANPAYDETTNPDVPEFINVPYTTYVGRCGQHAGTEKRRKYSRGQIVDFTPEIIEIMLAKQIEDNAIQETQRQKKAAEDAARTEAYRARSFAEAAQEFIVVRLDEEGPYNFAASRETGFERRHPDIPRWLVVDKTVPEDQREHRYAASVKIQRAPGWPTEIATYRASTFKINEARAFGEAFALALEEAAK